MSQLVTHTIKEELRVAHTAIAKEFGHRQDAVRVLIEKYPERFESLGQLTFQMEVVERSQRGATEAKVYYLNEDQFNLLLNMFRNSEDKFDAEGNLVSRGTLPIKTRIIQEFRKAKSQLIKNAQASYEKPVLVQDRLALLQQLSKSFQQGAAEAMVHKFVQAEIPEYVAYLPKLEEAVKGEKVHTPETGVGFAAVSTQAAGVVTTAKEMFETYGTTVGYQALERLGYGVRLKYTKPGRVPRVTTGPLLLTEPSCYAPGSGFIIGVPGRITSKDQNNLSLPIGHTFTKFGNFVQNVPAEIITKIENMCKIIVQEEEK